MSVKRSVFSGSSFLNAYLGNLFEHYDTALFSFLSPFLAPLLFPKRDAIVALILTYAIVPLGMFIRPVGALFFGYIGDRYGRIESLFISLAGMGVVSGCIGLIPSYLEIGVLAPILIYLARLLQNFFAAGEVNGGAIFLLEQTQEEKHDLLSGIYNASTIGGILLASAGISWLCFTGQVEENWRWLYFFGFITALFGCILRFPSSYTSKKNVPNTLGIYSNVYKILKEERMSILVIAIVSGFSYANYTMALVLMNGFVPLVSSLTAEQMTTLNTSLLIIDFVTLPFFGWLASKISRGKLMLCSALAVTVCGLPLIMMLEGASFVTVLLVRICLVFFGVSFCAPFYSWAQQYVSPRNRCLIISFGYAIGCQLIGSPTAALSLWLFKVTQMVSSVALYWVLLSLASAAAISWSSQKQPERIESQSD